MINLSSWKHLERYRLPKSTDKPSKECEVTAALPTPNVNAFSFNAKH